MIQLLCNGVGTRDRGLLRNQLHWLRLGKNTRNIISVVPKADTVPFIVEKMDFFMGQIGSKYNVERNDFEGNLNEISRKSGNLRLIWRINKVLFAIRYVSLDSKRVPGTPSIVTKLSFASLKVEKYAFFTEQIDANLEGK